MTETQPHKLIIMGIRGIPAAHGGFETFAEHLAPYLRDRDWYVSVYCQGSRTGSLEIDRWEGIERIHIPVRHGGALGTIEFDIKCVVDVAKREGTILTLGYNTGFLAAWLRLKGRRNFINMDGMEWKRGKYGFAARFYLWLNERLAAWSGTGLIADHPEIERRLRKIAPRAHVAMIPYGGDAPAADDLACLSKLGLKRRRYMTLIARPEAENMILEIVTAFSAIQSDAKLAILGKYDPATPYHSKVLAAAGAQVLFLGPIYDRTIVDTLRNHCLAYVHGHQVGGTNPSLVEALAAGNAIIANDNVFNRWVSGDAALYFSNAVECRTAIANVLLDETLRERLAKFAIERWTSSFSWTEVLAAYESQLR